MHKFYEASEADEQAAVIKWCEWANGTYTGVNSIFHIPNGGKRNKLEAARLKMQGVKSGVPDLFLPIAKGGYHGFFIEMKSCGGRVSNEQRIWLNQLALSGYKCKICYGADEAIEAIINYYGEKEDMRE